MEGGQAVTSIGAASLAITGLVSSATPTFKVGMTLTRLQIAAARMGILLYSIDQVGLIQVLVGVRWTSLEEDDLAEDVDRLGPTVCQS